MNNTLTEENVLEFFISSLSGLGINENKLHIEKKAEDYLTLMYSETDIIRVRVSKEYTSWISFGIPYELRKEGKYSYLFPEQLNWREIHWKTRLNSMTQLNDYILLAKECCIETKLAGDAPIPENALVYCDYFKNVLVSLGADEYFINFSRYYDKKVSIQYCMRDIISFKILKTKKYLIFHTYYLKKSRLRIHVDDKSHLYFDTIDNIKNNKSIFHYIKYMYSIWNDLENYYRKHPEDFYKNTNSDD